MTYTFYMVLNVGWIDLFNTVSEYLTLGWFKVASQYQAHNAGNIPVPSHFGLVSPALIGWRG